MAIRNIIQIDEEKCNGCGQCVVDCAEAALQVVDGKAKIVKEIYCDGLGACIGGCPTGALTIVQKEADLFDEAATERHVHETRKREEAPVCAGVRTVEFAGKGESPGAVMQTRSELSNWPVQLKLVPAKAPFLENADLLFAADCAAFSAADFHGRFMRGKKLFIACPKLDDAEFYYRKLKEILDENSIKSMMVVRMEVPCCGGLTSLTKKAIAGSGKNIPLDETVIGIKGNIVREGKNAS